MHGQSGLVFVFRACRQAREARTFLEAFFDSQTAIPLPIWQVFKIDTDNWDDENAVTGELEWGAAWKQYEELRVADPDSRFVVHQPVNP